MRDTNGKPGLMRRFTQWLLTSVDGASLGMFRIMFGSVMVWEAYDFLTPLVGDNRITKYFYNVHWNVPHAFTTWLHPWLEPWMHIQTVVMGLAAICLAVGLYSRLSALVVFLTWTHLFLLDAAQYNNHYYLASIFALMMAVMPSGECYSLDRQMRAARLGPEANESTTIPFATIFVLRAQLLIVYFFGGLTKINADWLLKLSRCGKCSPTRALARRFLGFCHLRRSTSCKHLFKRLKSRIFLPARDSSST